MGRGVKIPWIGVKIQWVDGGVKIPWIGGQNTIGRGFNIPWIGVSKYHE